MEEDSCPPNKINKIAVCEDGAGMDGASHDTAEISLVPVPDSSSQLTSLMELSDLQEQRQDFASNFVRMYTQQPGDYMQRNLEESVIFQKRMSLVLFSEDPISAALSLVGFQCLLVVGGFAWILAAASKVQEVHGPGYFNYLMEQRVRQFAMQDMAATGKLACGWESFLELFANCLVGFLAMAAGVLSRVSVRLVKQVIIVGGLIDAICNLCIFAQMIHAGREKTVMGTPSYVFFVDMFTDVLVFPLPLIRWEAFAIELIAAGSLIRTISIGASSAVPYKCIPIFVFSAMLLGVREVIKKRTIGRVRRLWERLDEGWCDLKEVEGIQEVKEAVARAEVKSKTSTQGGVGGGGDSFTWLRRQSLLSSSSSEPSMIVQYAREREDKDLDQLYAQAVLLEPMFLSKVQSFAEASDGYFLMNSPSVQRRLYLRWRDCKDDGSNRPRVKWASIKNANRAIEKILLLCNGDSSRLTDIVRQTIVFKDLRQLRECVDVISNDPEVEVVRIKNRLDPEYDASTSGGYRDVGLNLRVIHEGAKRLGVAGHVCELRLAVQSLHMLMDRQDHAVYQSVKHVLRFRRAQEAWKRRDAEPGEEMQERKKRRSSATTDALLPTHMSSSMGYSKSLAKERSDIALLIYKGMYPGSILDKYLTSSGHGVSKAETTSILYSSHPLRNVLHKTLFQLLLLLAGIGFIVHYIFQLNPNFLTNRVMPLRHARVVLDGFANASAMADAGVAIEDFSVLRDTCHEYKWTSRAAEGNKVIFSFPRVLLVNGLKLSLTPPLISYLRRASLSFSYLDEAGIDNITAVAEGWKGIRVVNCKLFPQLPLCRPDFAPRPDESLFLDLRYTWHEICIVLIAVLQILCCFGAAASAWLKHVQLAKTIFASAFHLVGVFEIFVSLPSDVAFYNHRAFFLSWGVLDVCMGLVLQFQERYMLQGLILYSVTTSFFPPLVQRQWDFSKFQPASDIATSSVALLGLVILVMMNRRYIVYRSRRQIQGDMRMYEDCWQALASQQGAQELLASLSCICKRVKPQQALQHTIFDASCEVELTILNPLASILRRQRDNSFARTYLSRPKLRVKRKEREIKSLDQLYAQAILLEPIFLSKVQLFAEASDGYFLGADGGLVRWRECKDDEAKVSRVKWASIKNANRAIEKLVRSYFGRVAKLTDVMRQTIVFKDLRQLCECVDVISNDPEVEVVRIKNRLDPDYDASTSGGYRDVGLNLRVIHEGAKRLGVAGHVCELQLLLEEFVKLKSADGHKRYVHFRNSRCE